MAGRHCIDDPAVSGDVLALVAALAASPLERPVADALARLLARAHPWPR